MIRKAILVLFTLYLGTSVWVFGGGKHTRFGSPILGRIIAISFPLATGSSLVNHSIAVSSCSISYSTAVNLFAMGSSSIFNFSDTVRAMFPPVSRQLEFQDSG